MHKKFLWKIEELWKKYYSLSLRATKQSQQIKKQEILNRVQNDSNSVCHSGLKVNCEARRGAIGYGSESHQNSNFCHSGLDPESHISKFFKRLYKNNISIYNSDFHFVSKFDFEASKNPAHSDDYGEYLGLEKSQVLEKDGKLIYLFDNHNKIIQPFLEYAEIIDGGFDVVHIDAHEDDAVFPTEKPHHLELKNVQEYIAETRISDFFDFIVSVRLPEFKVNCEAREGSMGYISGSTESNKNKLIKNIHRYTKSSDFKEFKKPKNPYILSLDIDIFGPEGDFIDLESKIKIIAEAWQHADVVCIATSPGFIDQDFAKDIIEIFVK